MIVMVGIVVFLVVGFFVIYNLFMVLVIGVGLVFFCYVNDVGFWMVKEYFGLNLK